MARPVGSARWTCSSCPLLGAGVERKLALRWLSCWRTSRTRRRRFFRAAFPCAGVAPRVFLAESGDYRWAPGAFLAWNVGTFCEKAGVSRGARDAKVRSCKREELDVTLPVPNDATLVFSLAKK